jgi:hypothetical protein
VLALVGDTCTVEFWLGMSIATQGFMMLADVPADGATTFSFLLFFTCFCLFVVISVRL